MHTAVLVSEGLPQFAPTTNHYMCSDGSFLLVTIQNWDVPATIESLLGFSIPILKSHLPEQADVFLADENAVVLDANGDPSDGMTPMTVVPGCTSFADALTEVGYTLT